METMMYCNIFLLICFASSITLIEAQQGPSFLTCEKLLHYYNAPEVYEVFFARIESVNISINQVILESLDYGCVECPPNDVLAMHCDPPHDYRFPDINCKLLLENLNINETYLIIRAALAFYDYPIGPYDMNQWKSLLLTCSNLIKCGGSLRTCHAPPPPPGCGDPCQSDCYASRFDGADEVFYGELLPFSASDVFPVKVQCWLKPPIFSNITIYNFSYYEKPCGDNFYSYPKLAIYFVRRSNITGEISHYAKPIAIDVLPAWQLATEQCGTEVFYPQLSPTPSSPFCCAASSLMQSCNDSIFVSSIVAENQEIITTTLSTPATTSLFSGKCEEETCPFEMCDSDCIMVRYQNATDVFWGESRSNTSVLTYCWLKASVVGNVPSSVQIVLPSQQTGRCNEDTMSVPSNPGPFLFFMRRDSGVFRMSAKPVKVSSSSSWRYLMKLDGIIPREPNANHSMMPFGLCASNANPPVEDIAIRQIAALNEIPCPGANDSLSVRFSDFPKFAIINTLASVGKSGTNLLTHFCAIDPASYISGNFDLLMHFNMDDASQCYYVGQVFNEIRYTLAIAPSPQHLGQYVAASMTLAPKQPDGWQAISQMCSLRRSPQVGTYCQSSEQSEGCFFDLSAREVQDNSFDLKKRLSVCGNIKPDSYGFRANAAESVIYGKVKDFNYPARSFQFEVNCVLKNWAFDIKSSPVTLQIPSNLDGCFNLDKDESYVVFLDKSNQLIFREVAVNNTESIAQFASVCGSFVGGCQAKVDPKQGCYRDLKISDVLSNKPPNTNLTLPTCCSGLATNITGALFQEADQIVWATVDSMITLTIPNNTADNDRLIGISLIGQCYAKSILEQDANIAVLANLASLQMPLHAGLDYILLLRLMHNSPWREITYELIAPPIQASKTAWDQLCQLCGADPAVFPLSPYPNGVVGDRCGNPLVCYSLSHPYPPTGLCIDNIDAKPNEKASCVSKSDNFTKRMEILSGEGGALLYGQVITVDNGQIPSMKADLAPIKSQLKTVFPLFNLSPKIQHIFFKASCQLSGVMKPSTNEIYFTYFETECFFDPESTFSIGQSYLVFLNSIAGLLTAAPIPIDVTGVLMASQSCFIKPPPFAILDASNDERFEEVCPRMTTSPKLCNSTLLASQMRSLTPYNPNQTSDDMPWWAILAISLGSVLGLLLIGLSWRFVVVSRRRQRQKRQSLQAAPLPNSNIYLTDFEDDQVTIHQATLPSRRSRITNAILSPKDIRMGSRNRLLGDSGQRAEPSYGILNQLSTSPDVTDFGVDDLLRSADRK